MQGAFQFELSPCQRNDIRRTQNAEGYYIALVSGMLFITGITAVTDTNTLSTHTYQPYRCTPEEASWRLFIHYFIQ